MLSGIVRYYLAQQQPDRAWDLVQTQSVPMASEVAVGYLEAGQPEQALEVVKALQPQPRGGSSSAY